MSWLENLNSNVFSIKTGDGKIYFPKWKATDIEKERSYNYSVYNFIELEGTLVDKKKRQSNKHQLVFYFDGENHLQDSNEFGDSADDVRLWEVNHPFYGVLKGKNISIRFKNPFLNVTEIVVDFLESISEDLPKSNVSVKDFINDKNNLVYQNSINTYITGDFKTIDIEKNKDALIICN